VSVAKRDDKESLNDLLELGYINAENIADVIESVSVLKDASITDYLLEMKRVNFGRRASDFDL
jgi:ACT domain-containing protein